MQHRQHGVVFPGDFLKFGRDYVALSSGHEGILQRFKFGVAVRPTTTQKSSPFRVRRLLYRGPAGPVAPVPLAKWRTLN
jgi:hypothetical protein